MQSMRTKRGPAGFGALSAIGLLATTLATPGTVLAQSEEFSFDWSGQNDRHLRVNLLSGGVRVQGYDGDQVLISVSSDMADLVEDEPEEGGMRRLPNGGQNLVVRQDGGEIIVRAGTADEAAQVAVRVPRNTRLTIHSTMDGAIAVENVIGEMDINSSAGPVEVIGLANAAVIHAHADDLVTSLATRELPGPLVLTSWAGDVELTLPVDLSANLRWRTNFGDVLTNLDVQDIQTVTERKETDDGVRLEGFTTARLNGGGPEISITAYTGDITLRKAE